MENEFDANKYKHDAFYIRGMIIDQFCILEKYIEYYIGKYFSVEEDKHPDFMNVILDRLTFESKRASIKAISDKREIANGFVKSKSNRFPHNELFDEIRQLIEERNYFAHYFLIIPKTNKGVIGLAKIRDSYQPKWYSIEDIDKLIDRIDQVEKKLEKLFEPIIDLGGDSN